jgi:hypothetical protein
MKPKKYGFINKIYFNLGTTMEQGIPKMGKQNITKQEIKL